MAFNERVKDYGEETEYYGTFDSLAVAVGDGTSVSSARDVIDFDLIFRADSLASLHIVAGKGKFANTYREAFFGFNNSKFYAHFSSDNYTFGTAESTADLNYGLKWNRVYGTFDNGTLTVNINGVEEVLTVSNSVTTIYQNPNANLVIGGASDGGYKFNGDVAYFKYGNAEFDFRNNYNTNIIENIGSAGIDLTISNLNENFWNRNFDLNLVDSCMGKFNGVGYATKTVTSNVLTSSGNTLPFTLMATLSVRELINGVQVLFGKAGIEGFYISSNGSTSTLSVQIRLYRNGSTVNIYTIIGPSLVVGQMYNIALTFNGDLRSSQPFTLYVNGVAVGTHNNPVLPGDTSVALYAVVKTFGLGACGDGSSPSKINAIRACVWEEEVDVQSAIDNDYDVSNSTKVFDWVLSSKGSLRLFDVSGNENHATLTSATISDFWSLTQNEMHYNIHNGFSFYKPVPTGSNRSCEVSRWVIKAKKFTTATEAARIMFMSDNSTLNNGYAIYYRQDGNVFLEKFISGSVLIMASVSGQDTTSGDFIIEITRDGSGNFSVKFNDVEVITHTDNTHTTSTYIVHRAYNGYPMLHYIKGGAEGSEYEYILPAVRFPALIDGSSDVFGESISNPAGRWHNNAETKLEFPESFADIQTDVNVSSLVSGHSFDWVGDWISPNTNQGMITIHSEGGANYLRVSYAGSTYPLAEQRPLVSGRTYRITGRFRASTGRGALVYIGSNAVASTISTTWVDFDVTAVANNTQVWFAMAGSGTSCADYAEFDNIKVWEVDTIPPLQGDQFEFDYSDVHQVFSNNEKNKGRQLFIYSQPIEEKYINKLYKYFF